MVTILHISDLHFTRDESKNVTRDASTNVMRDASTNVMRELLMREARERVGARPRGEKMLVVTGDFHNFLAPDYRDAIEFLNELVEAMDIDPAEDLFIVPGNHDVANDDLLGRVLGGDVPDWRKHKKAALKLIADDFGFLDWRMESFVPYCVFARSVGAYPPTSDPITDTAPAQVHVRRWREKLNVLHLNTALVADGGSKGDQLADVVAATDPKLWRKWYRDELPAIALGHNSFFDLESRQQDFLAAMFCQRNVSAYLCGDTHRTELDVGKQLIAIEPWGRTIPNIVTAKGVAETGDTYSDFGYYWHEWDEGTAHVEAQFHRWRRQYRAETAPESHPVCYRMRRKDACPKPGNDAGPSKRGETDPDAELRNYLDEVLRRRRNSHPSFLLLKVDEMEAHLYPKVEGEAQEYRQIPAQALVSASKDDRGGGLCPVWDVVRSSWSQSEHRNVVIIGESGIGKTVALFSITRLSEGMPVPTLYIPMYELVDKDGEVRELTDYVETSYSVYGGAIERLAAMPWEGRPGLLVLLDGFNEVPFALRRSLLYKINEWYDYHPGVQLVAVSRPIDGIILPQELAGDPIAVTLAPLDDDTIDGYLRDAGRRVPSRDSPIWEDLRYPLFLNLYIKTGRLRGKAPAGYPLHVMESESGGSLVWNYLQRELLRHMRDSSKKAEVWVLRCAVANEYILPYIAYRMVSANRMDVSYDQAKELTMEALEQLEDDALPSHLGKVWVTYQKRHGGLPTVDMFTCQEWLNTVLQDTGVLIPIDKARGERAERREGGTYVFMHQSFRDCLAGLHLVNQAETAVGGAFPTVWGQIQSHLSLRFASELIEQTERGVLQLLWDANRESWLSGKGEGAVNGVALCNLLELCRRNGKLLDKVKLDFSGMDLRETSLARYLMGNESALPLFRDRSLSVEARLGRLTFEIKGHSGRVTCVDTLRDGRAVSGSTDGTLMVWDLTTGECLKVLGGHSDRINCVVALPNGRAISGSYDQTLMVWDLSIGECLKVLGGHSGGVTCVAALDDKRVVSGSVDGALSVWDLSSGDCQRMRKVHSGRVTCVAALDDGRVVSGSVDGALSVWDLSSDECQRMLEGHSDWIDCIATLSDGCVISGSHDRTLRVWDLSSGECRPPLTGHSSGVTCVAALSGGRAISGSGDETLRVWELSSGKCLKVLEGYSDWIDCVAALDDGRVVSGSADGALSVWDLSAGKRQRELRGHSSGVTCVAALPDVHAIIGSCDRSLRVWDYSTGKCLHVLSGHSGWVDCVAALPDGRVVSHSHDRSLRMWDPSTGGCLCDLRDYADRATCAVALDDGRVVSGSVDGALSVWDLSTGERPQTLKGHSGGVTCVAALNDGRVVGGSGDGALWVWDLSTGERARTLKGHSGGVTCVAALPDGRVVSGSHDRTIRVWDLSTCKCLDVFETTEVDVSKMDFSDAVLTDDLALLVWRGRAKISQKDYEHFVKPHCKP